MATSLRDQGHGPQASPKQPFAPKGTGPSTVCILILQLAIASATPTNTQTQEASEPPEGTKFCSKCQGISAKLEELLDRRIVSGLRPTQRVTSQGDLEHVVELSQKAKCSLCNFLSHMVEAYGVSQGHWWATSEVALYIGSAKEQYLGTFEDLPKVHDSPLLWIWPAKERFKYGHSRESLLPFSEDAKYGSAGIALELTDDPDRISGALIGPRADFELIRSWFDDCTTHHKASSRFPGICQTDASVLLDIPGFMVIDCSSRRLVYWSQLPGRKDCAYVALSYVWGTKPTSDNEDGPADSENWDHNAMKAPTPNPDSNNDRRLPSSLPQLIEDTITAVISLRFRYLWVDRYCIQDDPQTKHAQIQSMDTIYGSAALTIIAAEGNDPSYGLPGVSPRSDLPASVRIGSRTFVTVGTAGFPEKVKGSKWNTRAWTMQEAFLSSRCLFFLESGAYFQCSFPKAQRYESIREPPASVHSSSRRMSFLSGIKESIILTKGVQYERGLMPSGYSQLPEDYFARHLTFEYDSLNAFSGILRHLQSRKTPIHNLWGLLIFPVQDGWTSKLPLYRYNLAQSLAWSYVRDQSFSKIKLRQPTILPRKRLFPSWSWVDWRSRTALDGQCFNSTHTLQFSSHDHFISLVDLTAELSEGGVVLWENGNVADISWLATVSQPPRVLNIHGHTSHTQLRNITEKEWGEFCDRTFASNRQGKDSPHEKDRQFNGHWLGCKMGRKWVMIDSDGKHLHYPFEALCTKMQRPPWCWAQQGAFTARNLSVDAYHLQLQSESRVVANDEIFHSTTFDLRVILLGYDRQRMYYMVLMKSPVTDTHAETFERVNVIKVPLTWPLSIYVNNQQARRVRMARYLAKLERKHGNSYPGTPWEKMSTRII